MNSFFQYFLIGILVATLCACNSGDNSSDNSADKESSNSLSVVDFSGSTVSLQQPAKRIVALAPHLVENTFSAGAGDRLVGVVEFSDFPLAATKLPIVGGYEKTNHERILELNPDLVLTWQSGNSHSSIELLRELGLTIYVNQADTLEEVAKSIRDIGTLAGTSEKAEKAATSYLEILAKVGEKYKDAKKVTSFYQVWNSPLQTISGNHIISNAIEICGGENIYQDELAIAPIINIESVLKRDPEAIIASGMSSARPEWLNEWKRWDSLQAVQKNNLFFVNPDHIQRHTVRLLDGINRICIQLDLARARNK